MILENIITKNPENVLSATQGSLNLIRQEDKDRIIAQINDLEYAVPPRIVFTADQYEINQALLNEEKEITLRSAAAMNVKWRWKRISSLY